jgi:hypothetical protein
VLERVRKSSIVSVDAPGSGVVPTMAKKLISAATATMLQMPATGFEVRAITTDLPTARGG